MNNSYQLSLSDLSYTFQQPFPKSLNLYCAMTFKQISFRFKTHPTHLSTPCFSAGSPQTRLERNTSTIIPLPRTFDCPPFTFTFCLLLPTHIVVFFISGYTSFFPQFRGINFFSDEDRVNSFQQFPGTIARTTNTS